MPNIPSKAIVFHGSHGMHTRNHSETVSYVTQAIKSYITLEARNQNVTEKQVARNLLVTCRGSGGKDSSGYLRVANVKNPDKPLTLEPQGCLAMFFQKNRKQETEAVISVLVETADFNLKNAGSQECINEQFGEYQEDNQNFSFFSRWHTASGVQNLIYNLQRIEDENQFGRFAIRLENKKINISLDKFDTKKYGGEKYFTAKPSESSTCEQHQKKSDGFSLQQFDATKYDSRYFLVEDPEAGEHVYYVLENLSNEPIPIKLTAEGHLIRTKEIKAAYGDTASDKAGILGTMYYLVKEQRTGEEDVQLLIRGGKLFRIWAKKRLQEANCEQQVAQLSVIGVVRDYLKYPRYFSGSVRFHAYNKCLGERLVGLANYGYVHGNIHCDTIHIMGGTTSINPDRMIFYPPKEITRIPESQELQEGTLFTIDQEHNPSFSHPVLALNGKAGFEQDLYSVSILMLCNAMQVQGLGTKIPEFLKELEDNFNDVLKKKKEYGEAVKTIGKIVEKYCYKKMKKSILEHKTSDESLANYRLLYTTLEPKKLLEKVLNPLSTKEASKLLPIEPHVDRKVYIKLIQDTHKFVVDYFYENEGRFFASSNCQALKNLLMDND